MSVWAVVVLCISVFMNGILILHCQYKIRKCEHFITRILDHLTKDYEAALKEEHDRRTTV